MMYKIAGNCFPRAKQHHAGLTLMEMTVAVGLLVIVILSVGMIFQNTSKAVGMSQSTLEMMSNARALQQQLERDVAGMDKNCFLVIRGITYKHHTDSGGNPVYYRCDLVSFVSNGSFPHRTGADSTTPFTDNNPVAPAAFITWGQLALAKRGGTNSGTGTDATVYLDATDQTYQVPLDQWPTGLKGSTSGDSVNDAGMALGRNALLLFPKNVTSTNDVQIITGLAMGAFQDITSLSPVTSAIDWNTGLADKQSSDGSQSQITQSRVDVAATTPGQIMNNLMQAITKAGGRASVPRFEADHFCYRHAAVTNVFDGVNVANGYFRMHPIILQGVSSFAVEWTDGTPFAVNDTDPVTRQIIQSTSDPLYGTTRWFGPGNPKTSGASLDPNPCGGTARPKDNYCALFSYDTPYIATFLAANPKYPNISKDPSRKAWPVALRFRFHVTDPTGRLQGGRDFVEVVKLPD